jgi:hypothetical protein
MDSEVLARELCDRMTEVIPSGIGVFTEGDRLVFRSSYSCGRAGSYACQWLHNGRGSLPERVREAARLAFSDLQDFVDEETTEPWPGSTSPPSPNARLEAGRVIVWFGDPQAPDLAIPPIQFEDA